MATYQVQCQKCGEAGDLRLTFKDYDAIKDGSSQLACNSCTGTCAILFDPSSVQFVMKDGESGGWQSKAIKENQYRARRRQVMARRENDHVFKPRLQPNYEGMETGTWKDAQEVARTETAKVLGSPIANVVASTYDPLVQGAKT